MVIRHRLALRARVDAATPFGLLQWRTRYATSARLYRDLPRPLGLAHTAAATARAPRTPFADLAISGCTCSKSFALGRQAAMFHPESMLTLIRRVGRVQGRVTHTRHARRVRHLPLYILENLRLLRLRRLPVRLVVRPVGLAVAVSPFTLGDLR